MNRSVMFGFLENFPILGLYLTLKIVLTPCNRPDICMLLFTTNSPDIMNQHSFHASKYFVSRGEEALYIEFTSDFTQTFRLSSITQHFSLSLLPFREYNQGMHAVYNKGNHVVQARWYTHILHFLFLYSYSVLWKTYNTAHL